MRHLYLDYNSTTPIAPSVQESMLPFLAEHFGDPANNHSTGRACREAVADARGQLAHLLGADAEEIVFTSGGTESNNLALLGTMLRHQPGAGGHLIISAIEHDSVAEPAKFLERLGYDVTVVGVTGQGVVQPSAIQAALRDDTVLASIMHANHETGVIQPLRQIAEFCHARNVLLHTDASQSVGKIRTFVDELDVDLLTVAGHKVYAPKGIGALFVRRGVPLEPLLRGSGQERGLRGGIENTPAIVGLGRAAMLAARALEESPDRLEQLRDQLFSLLQAAIGDELILHGQLATRLPNTLSLSFPGVAAHELLARVPELCAHTCGGSHTDARANSPTLAAMGIDPQTARQTLRLSLGWYTAPEDISRAANLLLGAWESLRE
ncbi:Cysteine desulfurase [Anatilimnocola aggregata]|uniref:cysteine desulfurase n=1 Tax=Anatilimnocola aggregata TaxID=2528021 RepID=A0A517Y867_9BACT|nr:cysteine desulfurase family protein [Anatilimnocola aggregata]QDU26444.1 Cysteine desulfurase [Anatilimnocola aggregata]